LAIGSDSPSATGLPTVVEAPFKEQIEQFAKADKEHSPPASPILFVGSSSIVMWKTLERDMAPLVVLNRGFGGSEIGHVNYWFDRVVAPYHPRAIVFYAGENDVADGISVEIIVADFDAFMARKSAELGGIPVYFISLKPSVARFEQYALQTKVNEAIRARSSQRTDLHFIDIVAPMLQDGKPKDLFQSDNLHMTEKGYEIWTQAVKTALLQGGLG
jgi:lysophospholipase L1-like esterase